jgi:Effector-associated domain 11
MDSEKLKEKLKDLIAKNRIKDAINLLRDYINEQNTVNQIILLSGRYTRLTEAIRMDIMELSEANIEENKIMKAIIEIIDETEFDYKTIFDPESRNKIKEVLSLCYKRAIFTRLHAQLSLEAMIESLIDTRIQLQKKVIGIEPKKARELVVQIISEIDYIERLFEEGLDKNWERINPAKLRIIASLISLSQIIEYEFEIPTSLSENVFFTKEEADLKP